MQSGLVLWYVRSVMVVMMVVLPFVARYDLANKALERRLLLEILGRHGGRQLERYFAYVALDDPSVVVRKEALKSLKVGDA